MFLSLFVLREGLLDGLTMEIDVQALDLDRLADPETHQNVGDDQDHEGRDGAPHDGGDDAPISIGQARPDLIT